MTFPQYSSEILAANTPLIERRKQQVRSTIRSLVDEERPVCHVDFPAHGNPGDAAIWLGETRALSHEGLDVSYLTDLKHYSDSTLRRRLHRGTILLHGGGNFGDIYPQYQRLREDIASRFPNSRIVQLPQSIHFQDADELRRSAATLGSHRDFTLLARDAESYAFAREHFDCLVGMCPDSAFMLGPLRPSPVPAESPIVWMSRVDPERAHEPPRDVDVPVTDWYTGIFLRKAWRLQHRARRAIVSHVLGFERVRTAAELPWSRLFDPLALAVFRSGLRVLARGSVIVTDRLHAHILCLLLGKPHVLLDNSYGKLSRFRETWTADAHGVEMASTPEEALERARTMVSRFAGPS